MADRKERPIVERLRELLAELERLLTGQPKPAPVPVPVRVRPDHRQLRR